MAYKKTRRVISGFSSEATDDGFEKRLEYTNWAAGAVQRGGRIAAIVWRPAMGLGRNNSRGCFHPGAV